MKIPFRLTNSPVFEMCGVSGGYNQFPIPAPQDSNFKPVYFPSLSAFINVPWEKCHTKTMEHNLNKYLVGRKISILIFLTANGVLVFISQKRMRQVSVDYLANMQCLFWFWIFICPSLDKVYYGTVMSACLSVRLAVYPSVCKLLHFRLLLQNHCTNFNQTWHKLFLGGGDFKGFKWRGLPFSKGR
jgi:hypothetical protein